MSQKQQHKHPFLTDFKKDPFKAFEVVKKDEQLAYHETIRKYYGCFYFRPYRIARDIFIGMLLIRFATSAFHLRRSLALSSPRNIWTGIIKYGVVPGGFACNFERLRYNQLMHDLEDLKDPEINDRYKQLLLEFSSQSNEDSSSKST